MAQQNLTSSQVLPGFYGFVSYGPQGSGLGPNLRCLLWGHFLSGASRQPNVPWLPESQQDADEGTGGAASDASRWYAAAISQPEAQGAEVWLVNVAEPSGSTSDYTLRPFLSGSNPTKPGTLQLWICSKRLDGIGFDTTDDADSICDAIVAVINARDDLPVTAEKQTISYIPSVLLTYVHPGATGEDLPIACNISPHGTGVRLSPGQMTVTTSASGNGSIKVGFGTEYVSTTVTSGDAAATMAQNVVDDFNADTYPLTAEVDEDDTTQVNFFFANDKAVNRMTAAVITSTATTVNLGSGATDGSGDPDSLSLNGTEGTGLPNLTAALSNLDNLDFFRSWLSPWKDETSLGSMATKIEADSDGSITGQKPQVLLYSDFRAMSVSGAIASSVSPSLTTSAPHYAAIWLPYNTVQTAEVAARLAAARAALWFDDPQMNWNGFQVRGNERAPILLPHKKPGRLTLNTALRTYALAPVIPGVSGLLELVKGRSTSLAADRRLHAWSAEACAVFHMVDLGQRFQEKFSGKSILRFSEPEAPDLIDAQSVIDEIKSAMLAWQKAGSYDGAQLFIDADAIKVSVNPNNPNRFDAKYPESPPVDLDQIAFVGLFTSPNS